MAYIGSRDDLVKHAEEVIFSTYGDVVSVQAKAKDLLKFGRNRLCNTVKTTLMTLPTGINNETYISTNGITTISSSINSDTQTLTIEGHTISAGVFTFVTQNVTLNGRNQVTLSTPLARVTRAFNIGSVDLVGNIYIYETDTTTGGVPNTGIKVHLIIEAGLNNSEKAATTISNSDYYIITGFYADCLEKTSTYGTIHLEVREAGKVFRNVIDVSAADTFFANKALVPYIIVPRNADVRLRVISSAANKDFSGGFTGFLALVQ